jgi:hypothetical protein
MEPFLRFLVRRAYLEQCCAWGACLLKFLMYKNGEPGEPFEPIRWEAFNRVCNLLLYLALSLTDSLMHMRCYLLIDEFAGIWSSEIYDCGLYTFRVD